MLSRVVSTVSRVAVRAPAAHVRCLSAASEAPVLVTQEGRVGIVTLNRPKALNALNTEVARLVSEAVRKFDADPSVGAMVITGSDKAFAAGADIKEMSGKTFPAFASEAPTENLLQIDNVASARKPVVAAVRGFAFGGGCELAMMCDIIIAGDNAVFGQPEIKLGIIPGAAGTQRLTQAIGKSKAMQMVLTGDPMTAEAAERAGLVSEVVPADKALERAVAVASKIASMSQPIVQNAKDAVNASFEMSLAEGSKLERKLFFSCFACEDQREGMAAFVEKRKPDFKHK